MNGEFRRRISNVRAEVNCVLTQPQRTSAVMSVKLTPITQSSEFYLTLGHICTVLYLVTSAVFTKTSISALMFCFMQQNLKFVLVMGSHGCTINSVHFSRTPLCQQWVGRLLSSFFVADFSARKKTTL